MDPRGTSLGRRSKHYGPIRGTPQTPQNGEGAPPGAAPPSPAQAEKAAEKSPPSYPPLPFGDGGRCRRVRYAYYKGEVAGSRRSADQVEVEIPQGAGTADIAAILEKEGAIGNSFIFRFYSKYKAEADGSYQYGSFTLRPKEGYDGIIEALQQVQQRLETVKVTFPEGYNAFQMAGVLAKAGLCSENDFITALNEHTFAVDFIDEVSAEPLKLVRLEGYLFPDTYEFYADEDVDSIILRMLTNFQNRVCTPENRAAMEKAGYSLEELVTLASIIQKESANVEEMYNVSSVFTNRLEEGSEYPKLESCTTNNFINDYITPYFGGAPSQEVLTAYDTYDRSGFPVGAIASAGADAIDAALHPEKNTLDGTYYFFVTDVEYTHYYGRTYQEHLQNIEKAKAVNRTHGIEGLIS